MIRHLYPIDDGITGMELVILLLVLVAGAGLMLMYFNDGTPGLSRTFPNGLVAESMYISGDHIQMVGNAYGFSMTSRILDTPPVIMVHEDPNRLGAVRFVVSLFIGDTGAIDMDRLHIQWYHKDGSEMIQKTPSRILICPNWTISGKYNLLPGRTADSDEWLEPNEAFELTLCSSEGVQPYEPFSLILQPEGIAVPLTITRTTPPRIQPVMNLD